MMNLRPAWRRALAALSLIATTRLGGCFLSQIPSADTWAKASVGRPVQEITDLAERPRRPSDPTAKFIWKPSAYTLPNGNSVYIRQVAKDCFIHFEVNHEKTVVGYRLEGTTCD